MKKFVVSLIVSLTLCVGLTLGFGVFTFSNAFAVSQNSSNKTSQNTSTQASTSETSNTYGVSNVSYTINTTGKSEPVTFKGVFSRDSDTSNSTNLISFLKIEISSSLSNSNNGEYDSVTIKRSNSGTNASTYTEKTDEYGTDISTANRTYYFTRETSFIVELKKTGDIVVSAQCSFSPVINENALKTLYSNICYFDGNYYTLGDGNSTITPKPTASLSENKGLTYDCSLYSISINDVAVRENEQINNNYNLTIPQNSYGKLKITFTSRKAFITRSFELIAINPQYSWNFFNADKQNVTDDCKFGDYYIFNELVDLELNISDSLIDLTKPATTYDNNKDYFNGFTSIYSKTPTSICDLIELTIEESVRNTSNTGNSKTTETTVNATENYWTHTFDEVDHSIFKLSTALKGAPKTTTTIITPSGSSSSSKPTSTTISINTYAISEDVLTFKTITKVPYVNSVDFNDQIGGRYEIAIYEHSEGSYYGGVKNESYNYINTALYGKLTRNTNIYFLSDTASIYNNDDNNNSQFKKTNTGSSTSSSSQYFTKTLYVKTDNNFKTLDSDNKLLSPFASDTGLNVKYDVNDQKTITIKNYNGNITNDDDFSSFYSFTFTATYYPTHEDASNKFFGNIIDTSTFSTEGNKSLSDSFIYSMFKDSSLSETNFLKRALTISNAPTLYIDGDLKLPVYMNLVYNFNKENYEKTTSEGKIFWDSNSFENFYELQAYDKIEFFEPGLYIVELYTFPTHEFAQNFVNRAIETGETSFINNSYIRFEFEIEGPSISATSTNNKGQTIPLSNRMLTQNEVRISVQFTQGAGQILKAYKNNVEFNTFNESQGEDGVLTFYLDRASYAGSWTFTVFDALGNALKSLNFSIVDTAYLGYTINDREEYELLEVFDPTGEQIPTTHCYDLLDEGVYKINIANSDKVPFLLTQDGRQKTTYAEKSATNTVTISVQKPYFEINFANTFDEDSKRTTENIEIGSVSGIEISKVTVFLNGKEIETFDPRVNDTGIGGIISSGHSYSKNGVYTVRITDKFNNSFEVQVEKYYKINYALIILIAIVVFALLFLIWFIYRSRRGIKVR